MFESIGYHAEKLSERREDRITRTLRLARRPMIVFVVAVGMVLPLTAAIRFDDPRALPAVPLAAGTIAVAAVALRARTPARRYGRMLLAVLLLALMSAVIILAKQPWWPISP